MNSIVMPFQVPVNIEKIYNRSELIRYFTEYFLSDLVQFFEVDGSPETIPKKYFMMNLLLYGKVGVIKHEEEFYITPFSYTGTANNYLYEPTTAIVVNSYFPEIDGNYKIVNTVQSTMVTLDYRPLVQVKNDFYTQGELLNIQSRIALMVDTLITQKMATINFRTDKLFFAETETEKQKFDKYIENIESGKNSTIVRQKKTGNNWQGEEKQQEPLHSTPQVNNYLLPFVEQYQYIKSQLLAEYGINSNHQMKRENLTTPELQSNDQFCNIKIATMLKWYEQGCEDLKKHFGLNISIKLAGYFSECSEEPETEETEETEEQEEQAENENN